MSIILRLIRSTSKICGPQARGQIKWRILAEQPLSPPVGTLFPSVHSLTHTSEHSSHLGRKFHVPLYLEIDIEMGLWSVERYECLAPMIPCPAGKGEAGGVQEWA